jgi:hypothetical protein
MQGLCRDKLRANSLHTPCKGYTKLQEILIIKSEDSEDSEDFEDISLWI